jgi:hypothetical protein
MQVKIIVGSGCPSPAKGGIKDESVTVKHRFRTRASAMNVNPEVLAETISKKEISK